MLKLLVKVESSSCRGWEGNSVSVNPTDFNTVYECVVDELVLEYCEVNHPPSDIDEFIKGFIKTDDFGFDSIDKDDTEINYEGDESTCTYYVIDKLEDLLDQ